MKSPWRFVVLSWLFPFAISALLFAGVRPAAGFGIYSATGLVGGSRWDTTPRTLGGVERSLNGGLRYSLQGGSYQAYRDLLSWSGTPPSVTSFQQAITEAFGFWTAVDPQTGLGTSLSFLPDLTTPVSTVVSGNVRLGAEIDLFTSTDGTFWNPGDTRTQGETFFSSSSVSGNLKLTSGTTNYPGFAISGADITLNSNTGAKYTLTSFRTILTHEIGHSIGLADVDVTSGPAGTFIDDNYSGATASTALSTLMNSFANKINTGNPSLSPLALYTVADGNPGFDTPGVDILMETNIPTIYFGSSLSLSNDDFAGRQFLYPVAKNLLHGDFNLDGKITNTDIQAMLNAVANPTAFKQTNFLTDAEYIALGDFNNSNVVDKADIGPFLKFLASGASPNIVPEPSTFALLALGAVLLPCARRQLRRS
jgi:hypothetical protein